MKISFDLKEISQGRKIWSVSESAAWICGSVIVGSALVTIGTSRRITSLFEAVITRGVFLTAALLFILIALSLRSRTSWPLVWARILRILPFAILFGVIISALGIWNDGSGALALPPSGVLAFFVTLGAVPVPFGPEAFLRGTVAFMAVALATLAYFSDRRIASALYTVVVAWIFGAVPLLIQSAMALIGARSSSFPLVHSQDALRALGAMHTNSYWSNFQSERFFVGIGRQLESGALLSSTAIAFLLASVSLVVLFFWTKPWNRSEIRRTAFRELIMQTETGLFAAAIICGIWLGISSAGWSWNGLDFVALMLLFVCVGSWYVHRSFSNDVGSLRDDETRRPWRLLPAGIIQVDDVHSARTILLLLAITAAMLLGWPVLFFLLAIFSVPFATRVVWIERPLLAALLVGLGAAFGTRQALLPKYSLVAAVIFAVFSISLVFWERKRLDG